jgi:CheY-like chemotaxis protein
MMQSEERRNPGEQAASPSRRLILVVDDDPSVCQFISEALDAEGYASVTASDGPSAFAALAATTPDLILLDVHMPGIDGWDVLRELRARSAPHQPIVVMTGRYEGQDRALSSGAQGYLAKPFDLSDLLDCVELHSSIKMGSDLGERLPQRR